MVHLEHGMCLTDNWQKYVQSLKNLHKIPLVKTRKKSVFKLLKCDTHSLGKTFPTRQMTEGQGIRDPEDKGTTILLHTGLSECHIPQAFNALEH